MTATSGMPLKKLGKLGAASGRVTGVITGASPKAIINGRLVRPGDMIDAGEGIALDSIDAANKQLVFRSRSGATATKSY